MSVTTASLTVMGSDPITHLHNDSSDTRFLLGPTARSLKRGEAYIDDVSLFFPSVQVGLSDRVSIGVGTPVALPTSDIHPGDAIWITPAGGACLLAADCPVLVSGQRAGSLSHRSG